MEALTKLEVLSNQHNLQLQHNDRLFYGKYLYRLSVLMYQYSYPELLRVPTIDLWGYKVDTEIRRSFTGTLRRFANKHSDRVRVEGTTVNYYTDDIGRIQKVVGKFTR